MPTRPTETGYGRAAQRRRRRLLRQRPEPSRGEKESQVNRREGWVVVVKPAPGPKATPPPSDRKKHTPTPTRDLQLLSLFGPRPSVPHSSGLHVLLRLVLEDPSISPRGPTPPPSRPRLREPAASPGLFHPDTSPGLPVGQRGCSLGPCFRTPRGSR